MVAFLFFLWTGSCDHRTDTSTKTITVWYSFGNDLAKQLRMICDDFQKTHPGVHVQLSYSANDLTSNQKLFLAIAGGVGPDVTFVDGQQLAEWAARGAMEDITDQVKRAGISAKDFWRPRWQESNFAGRTYALPWGADPNFALVWNKSAFREVGLDPDRAPQTLDELAADAKKLTKYDARGQIVRIGFIPWEYEFDNCMFTFGYLFGGEFYKDPPPGEREPAGGCGTVTANDPHNVAALRWLNDYAKQYDVRKMTSTHENAAGLSNHPFYIGAEAMALMHITQMHDMQYYAPTMDFGVGYLPPPPGGEEKSGWIGGWSLAIPRGSHVSDDAFEFIRWMCIDDRATTAMGNYMSQFPACRHSPSFDTIKDDPRLGVYYQILLHSKHVRTRMPVQGYLMSLLDRGVADVLYGQRDPQQVLDEVTREAQKRLEHVVGRMERQ